MGSKKVGLMARYPEPGRVKTRLAASIGDARACAVYERLLNKTIEQVLTVDSGYGLGCFVEPQESVHAFSLKYPGLDFYEPQLGDDLGDRMYRAFTQLLGPPEADAAILIGGDIPGLTSQIICRAFECLATHDIVWGPSTDGGYYLIGLRIPIEMPFRNISWSTPEVLNQSMRLAKQHDLRYAVLDTPLNDIDTLDDLKAFDDFRDLIE